MGFCLYAPNNNFLVMSEIDAISKGTVKADIWKLSPTARGEAIEAYLAKTEYADWGHIGATQGGYFPVIDFVNVTSNKAVSLKSINPKLTSYANGKVNDKILSYLDELDRPITSTGPFIKLGDVKKWVRNYSL
mgnify:CR=1 FL=1